MAMTVRQETRCRMAVDSGRTLSSPETQRALGCIFVCRAGPDRRVGHSILTTRSTGASCPLPRIVTLRTHFPMSGLASRSALSAVPRRPGSIRMERNRWYRLRGSQALQVRLHVSRAARLSWRKSITQSRSSQGSCIFCGMRLGYQTKL